MDRDGLGARHLLHQATARGVCVAAIGKMEATESRGRRYWTAGCMDGRPGRTGSIEGGNPPRPAEAKIPRARKKKKSTKKGFLSRSRRGAALKRQLTKTRLPRFVSPRGPWHCRAATVALIFLTIVSYPRLRLAIFPPPGRSPTLLSTLVRSRSLSLSSRGVDGTRDFRGAGFGPISDRPFPKAVSCTQKSPQTSFFFLPLLCSLQLMPLRDAASSLVARCCCCRRRHCRCRASLA